MPVQEGSKTSGENNTDPRRPQWGEESETGLKEVRKAKDSPVHMVKKGGRLPGQRPLSHESHPGSRVHLARRPPRLATCPPCPRPGDSPVPGVRTVAVQERSGPRGCLVLWRPVSQPRRAAPSGSIPAKTRERWGLPAYPPHFWAHCHLLSFLSGTLVFTSLQHSFPLGFFSCLLFLFVCFFCIIT